MVGRLDRLREGELRGPLDRHEHVQLAFGRAPLGDVDLEGADRIAFELFSGWLVAFDIGAPGDAMTLQAAMRRGPRQARDGWLSCVEAIIQRKQCVLVQGDDDRFLMRGNNRRRKGFG